MTSRPATARRPLRRAVAVVALLVLAGLVGTGPALAAGTGGIEVTPVPPVASGQQVTAFHVELPGSGSTQVPFLLRNVEQRPRSATVYAAAATRSPDGSYAVGDAGSSPYVNYPRRDVTLAQGEQRQDSFRVQRPASGRVSSPQYAALVVEVNNGSVVQRAATLVYLDPGSQLPVPLPFLVVLAAVLLLAVAAGAVLWTARRRRRQAELA